jgi:transposase
MKHKTVAVDIAKDVFEIAASDKPGRVLQPKRVMRSRFLGFFAKLSPSTVLLEACGSAHFWGRQLRELGHTAVLLPPHLVAVSPLQQTRSCRHQGHP